MYLIHFLRLIVFCQICLISSNYGIDVCVVPQEKLVSMLLR